MKLKPLHIIGYALLALFWGGSFLGIKASVEAIPPSAAASLRVAIAVIILFFCIFLRKEKIPSSKSILWQLFGIGFFTVGVPWALLFWGQQYVMPAMGSILNSTTPLFTVVIASLFVAHETVRWNKWLGAAIGFIGVILIFGPTLSSGIESQTEGMAAILGMAVLYAFGIVWLKHVSPHTGPATAFFIQGLGALAFLLPYSLLTERSAIVHAQWASSSAWIALLYLGICSTAIAQLLFFVLVRDLGSVRATTTSYLVPIVSIALDGIVFHKLPEATTFIGAAVILAGVRLTHARIEPVETASVSQQTP